jgi:hypothetical protein
MLNIRQISGLLSRVSPILLIGPVLFTAGCHDDNPPPPRVPVPVPSSDNQQYGEVRESDPVRPLPPPTPDPSANRPPFEDEPLVDQAPPEQPAFVDMYRKVGSPKITLFVNRGLDGDLVPVNTDEPVATITQTRSSNGPVSVESHDSYLQGSGSHPYGGWYDSRGEFHSYTQSDSSDKFDAKGPAEYRQTTDVYLHPGQYDEVEAKSLDYQALENIMTDWIACQGQVTVISPTLARQRLSDQQVKDLQSGRPQMLSEIAQQLGADILIQVQAHPTRQTPAGLEVRLVAEAMNTKGGQSLARATVDMEPPLTKTQINKYTRWLARKLMSDMTATWSAPPPPEMRHADAEPAPAPENTVPPAPAPAPQPAAPPAASSYPPEAAPDMTPAPPPTAVAPPAQPKMPSLFAPAETPAAPPPAAPTAPPPAAATTLPTSLP